jgi:hypothetical protein
MQADSFHGVGIDRRAPSDTPYCPADWPVVPWVAAAPVPDLVLQSFGRAAPGCSDSSQRESLLAVWLFFALVAGVPVSPAGVAVVSAIEEEPETLAEPDVLPFTDEPIEDELDVPLPFMVLPVLPLL